VRTGDETKGPCFTCSEEEAFSSYFSRLQIIKSHVKVNVKLIPATQQTLTAT